MVLAQAVNPPGGRRQASAIRVVVYGEGSENAASKDKSVFTHCENALRDLVPGIEGLKTLGHDDLDSTAKQ